MPIFEYICNDCNTKYEVLHKSASKQEKVVCPECNSGNYRKLLSSFSPSISSGSGMAAPCCSNGSCGMPASSPCANGMCGIN